jgi:hypothetical protein
MRPRRRWPAVAGTAGAARSQKSAKKTKNDESNIGSRRTLNTAGLM